MENKLDLKDKRILLALDMNARKPDSFIAKKVKLSKQLTNYRIKRLEEKEIIKSYYAVIDHSKLGLQLYRIGLKLENITTNIEKELLGYLKKHASWISSTLGEWDIWMALYAKDEHDFMNFWDDFQSKYGLYIIDREISLMTKFWNFERSFLLPEEKNRKNFLILGEKPNIIELDQIDKKIIQELTKNSRQSSLEIAKKIKETERVVRYRIKRLEKQKIILGYRTFIDTAKLGFGYYKMFIKLKDYTKTSADEVQNFIIDNPNVIYNTKSISKYDFELEGHFENSQALSVFIYSIKEKFPKLIRSLTILEYTTEHKITYYPLD